MAALEYVSTFSFRHNNLKADTHSKALQITGLSKLMAYEASNNFGRSRTVNVRRRRNYADNEVGHNFQSPAGNILCHSVPCS